MWTWTHDVIYWFCMLISARKHVQLQHWLLIRFVVFGKDQFCATKKVNIAVKQAEGDGLPAQILKFCGRFKNFACALSAVSCLHDDRSVKLTHCSAVTPPPCLPRAYVALQSQHITGQKPLCACLMPTTTTVGEDVSFVAVPNNEIQFQIGSIIKLRECWHKTPQFNIPFSCFN